MVIYDFDPRNLPSDFLAAIGLVMASFAQTDNALETFIGCVLSIDFEYQIAVTTHMPAPLKDSIARAASEIFFDDLDQLDALDDILDRIEMAGTKRNAFAHNTWARHPDTGDVFTVKHSARGSVSVDLIPQSVDHIKSEAALIYDAGMDLVGFMMASGLAPTQPPPRPRTHKFRSARKLRRKKLRESRLRGD